MWLAPVCMAAHGVYYTVGWFVSLWEFKKPWETTKKFTTGPHGQEFPEEWMANLDQSDDPLMFDNDVERGFYSDDSEYDERRKQEEFSKLTDVQRPTPAESKRVVKVANHVQSTTRQGLGFAAILWYATAGVTVLDLWPSLSLPVLAKGQGTRLSVEQLDIAWPVPGFEVVGLACSHGHMFAANSYQVFEINTMTNATQALPCDIDEEIVDVSLACADTTTCWPVVLLADSSVVECKDNGRTISLLKGIEAQRLAIRHAAASGLPSLEAGAIAASNGTAVEMRWNEAQQGLSPLWELSTVDDKEKIGGVAYDTGVTFLYTYNNNSQRGWYYRELLRVIKTDTWTTQKIYHVPEKFQGSGPETSGGFCAMSRGVGEGVEVYMSQSGDSGTVLRAAITADAE